MLWVVLDHIVERLAGGNFAGDPSADWPPLHDRIAQFTSVVTGFGPYGWPLTALRDFGWLADQAVTIFIILSGFGLTIGMIASRADARIDARDFFGRRLRRIYPQWWGAHLLFLPFGYLFASGLSTGDWQFYASFLGLRCIPGVFSYFAGSWWYVGVIIQLYLFFPLLWWLLRTRGPLALLGASFGAGFLSLAIGHAAFHGDLLEMWQRGIFAITRLPEFAFGMAFAMWWARDPSSAALTLRRPAVRIAALAVYAVGFVCSFTLPGMIVAPTILGIGAIVLFYPLLAWQATGRGVLEFIGRHSLAIFLTHQYLFTLLVRPELGFGGRAAGILIAALATVVATFALERGTAAVEDLFVRIASERGRLAAGFAFGGAALAIVALPLGLELATRTFAYRDLSRFSDRIALRSDRAFGWRLVPSRTIVVRAARTYRITSNAEGFPGPAPASRRRPSSLRVFVLGDAVSSSGVDTEKAWPQLLGRDLRRTHRDAEVENFAISGYGPNEEASVARSYAPRYRPDVILVQVQPDDVQDVLTDRSQLREEIGLDGAQPDSGLRSILSLDYSRELVASKLIKPMSGLLRGRPSTEGYFSGQFVYLERGHDAWDQEAVRRSAERYREIAAAAKKVGAQTILVFFPAPAQVCPPDRLAYYPKYVSLSDGTRYDVGLPDWRARRIAAAAHVKLWDLTADLSARFPCAYSRHTRYLRPEAHRAVAAMVARRLLEALDSRPVETPVRFARTAHTAMLEAPGFDTLLGE